MRSKIIMLFCMYLTTSAYCQKYGNVWEFGKYVGIDFNSCTPILIANGKNPGFEGCSSLSDSTGQLLFYTNSDTVWNRLNNPMPNGSLISSGGTLSQVISIPKPLSNSIYYVFTTTIQGMYPYFQYHTIDMSLNSGLGDVVNKNNILTTTTITEQVAATYHQNNKDIWVMTHEYGTNRFLAYLVTSSGVTLTPVVSSVGPAHAMYSSIEARGEIKFSPDGTKIAFTANGDSHRDSTNIVCLFDFDKATGIVSNPIKLPVCRGDFGLSFSADNSKLYGATWKPIVMITDKNYLYQFDLSSGNPATIANSRYLVDSGSYATPYADIKLAPDGKIYVARSQTHYLGVINAPNEPAALCNYTANGFYVGPRICREGLNNYIEYTNYCTYADVPDINNEGNGVSVFPNPFGNNTTLTFKYSANTEYTLNLYNVQGQLIRSYEKLSAGVLNIERQGLMNGMYFFQLYNNKQLLKSGKLIVE